MLLSLRSKFYLILAVACLALAGACSKPAPESSAAPGSATVQPGTTMAADPNPVVTTDGSGVGETTINWTTAPERVEIRIAAPNGQLFARGGVKGSAKTGHWVGNGMKFYLQDSTAPDPTAASATLGTVTVTVK